MSLHGHLLCCHDGVVLLHVLLRPSCRTVSYAQFTTRVEPLCKSYDYMTTAQAQLSNLHSTSPDRIASVTQHQSRAWRVCKTGRGQASASAEHFIHDGASLVCKPCAPASLQIEAQPPWRILRRLTMKLESAHYADFQARARLPCKPRGCEACDAGGILP